ncbi:SGNH/GDSL hydrolase family protein [Streptomyces benahoarensis]|uniref:Inducer of phenazine A n=1 Tax=Streptomyces benahoarensis TaxID=2595054 RepID=A0A553YYR5_9ACTN|nr:GDSL-type esterase/lipase family protein [Streptomyces benahoarensis]TSB30427.1 Inducer of phenazine A [Streptomyces benahoarensis]TSB34367.1 Inducer of phenazine A [Streptomyces benahoarensis]
MKLRRYALTPQMEQYDDFDDRGETRYLPYLMYYHRSGYRSEVLNTDRLGFRVGHGARGHASVAGERPPGPVKLLVGSSTAFGIGATTDAATLSSRLWSRYAPSTPWLNFGGRSYSSAQELLLFVLHQHLLPPVEEIVILSGFNNLALARLPEHQQGEHGAFFFCGDYHAQMDALQTRHRKAKPGFGRRAQRRSPAPPDDAPVPPTPELIRRSVELTVRHLETWRKLASVTGARLSYVLQPLATWVRQEPAPQEAVLFKELDKMSRLGIFEDLFGDIVTPETGRAYAEALRTACEKQDVPFLDLNPVLAEATTPEDWLYVDRAHCTDHGYDTVARLLTDCLDLR